MTRLTPLETAVLDALADELRFEIPDLSGQIAEALPGVRRNTGFGFFTEVIVDRNRPGVNMALSGRLGSIHATCRVWSSPWPSRSRSPAAACWPCTA